LLQASSTLSFACQKKQVIKKSSREKEQKKKHTTSRYSLVVTHPTNKSADLRLVYGRADGMPNSLVQNPVSNFQKLIPAGSNPQLP
jgi:hypothetical protein